MAMSGWALPARKSFIQKLQQGPSIGQWPLARFQGKPANLAFYEVPIDLPKYRLANGRTQAAQQEYIATHSKAPKDFFRSDLESDEAQQAQHEILGGMINEEGLLKLFKDPKNPQVDPLILTSDGFVVNGNRRLCAYRALYAEDLKKYSHFQSIKAVILPHCTERDIDTLEADLQIKREIKAEYNWYTKACMFRSKRQEAAYSDDELATMYDLKVKEIQELIRLLEYAEKYLEAIGKPQQYHLVEEEFYAFEALTRTQQKIHDVNEKDLHEKISFVLINNSKRVGRLYETIPQVQDHLSAIAAKLREELPLKPQAALDAAVISAPAPSAADGLEAGSLDLLGGYAPAGDTQLVEAVEAPENKEKVFSVVQDVIESEITKKKQMKNKNFALDKIKAANTLLNDALSGLTKESTKDGIDAQLDAVIEVSGRIKKWIRDNA